MNFYSPAHECSVASPFWGTIPELIEVISLAQTGKIKMLVEHFPLDDAARGLPPPARRQDPGTRSHHTELAEVGEGQTAGGLDRIWVRKEHAAFVASGVAS